MFSNSTALSGNVVAMVNPNWKSRTMWTGDNLDIMRGMNSECVDLIYLDPPFNSNRNYSAPVGSAAAGAAFKDTWTLSDLDVAWMGLIADKEPALFSVLKTAHLTHGKGMQSYLCMMAVRLMEMRRLLKSTGSIYLHCDPTASHYLKVLMDALFGRNNFRNEVVWKRRYGTFSYVHKAKKFGICNDNLLFYAKSDQANFSTQYSFKDPDYQAYIRKFFRHKDARGRVYRIADLANPAPRPNLMYDYKGYPHPKNGWAISREKMRQWDLEGRLEFPRSKTGRIQRRRFLDELKGKPVQSIWNNVKMISSRSKERVGYPTQKPLALLDRIIKASSNPEDMVMDPFCGCATACVAAERLDRNWVGIDISEKAAELVQVRIRKEINLLHNFRPIHRTDIPRRTDLGELPNYRTYKHVLFGRQEGKCNGCQTEFPFRIFEIDHVIPRSRGGTDHEENLQLLCSHCNRVKGDRDQSYLMARLQSQ